jgi:hypothetical protein
MVRTPILFAHAFRGLLIDGAWTPRFIPSQLQRTHRVGGSERVWPVRSLWMNLWKLWIAERIATATHVRCLSARASMVAMDRAKGSSDV